MAAGKHRPTSDTSRDSLSTREQRETTQRHESSEGYHVGDQARHDQGHPHGWDPQRGH